MSAVEAVFRHVIANRLEQARADYKRERASEREEIEWAIANHRTASEKCWVARHEAERRLRAVEAMWAALAEEGK